MAKNYFFFKCCCMAFTEKIRCNKKVYVTKETDGIYHTNSMDHFFLYISFTGNSRTSLGKNYFINIKHV